MRDCCGFLQIRSHITMDTNITPLTLTDQPYRQSAPGWIITKSLGYKDAQGIFNERPPISRYSTFWDVGTMLRYFGSNNYLTLRQLTINSVMLLALAKASM